MNNVAIDMDAIGRITFRVNIVTVIDLDDDYAGDFSIHMAGSLNPEVFLEKILLCTQLFSEPRAMRHLWFILSTLKDALILLCREVTEMLFSLLLLEVKAG